MTVNTRPLTPDQVNSFLLKKQHLAPEARGEDVVRVVEDICALHATAALTPYLSLWSRVKRFTRQQFEAKLYEERKLVRILCMRRTLHIVPSAELPVFFQATKKQLQRSLPRQVGSLLVQAGLCQEGEEAETHLAKINGWTKEETAAYLEKVWHTWQERSRYEWKLNLAWLEDKGIRVVAKR